MHKVAAQLRPKKYFVGSKETSQKMEIQIIYLAQKYLVESYGFSN